MDDRTLNREIRLQAAFERLRTLEPKCVLCGHKKPHALELDHSAGKAFSKKVTEILCLNCHADRSDLQKDHPRQVDNPPHVLEVIAHLLSTLADHMLLMADRIYDIVAQLMNFHKTLVAQVPM